MRDRNRSTVNFCTRSTSTWTGATRASPLSSLARRIVSPRLGKENDGNAQDLRVQLLDLARRDAIDCRKSRLDIVVRKVVPDDISAGAIRREEVRRKGRKEAAIVSSIPPRRRSRLGFEGDDGFAGEEVLHGEEGRREEGVDEERLVNLEDVAPSLEIGRAHV